MREPRPYTDIGIMLMGPNPQQARVQILGALWESGGCVRNSAKILGVSVRSLHRWLDRLELREDLAKIREKISAREA